MSLKIQRRRCTTSSAWEAVVLDSLGFRKSLLVRRNKGKSLLVRRQWVDLFVVISLDQEGLLGKLKECAQVIIVGERELQAIWENGNNGAVALA